jgi:hypothetical protein
MSPSILTEKMVSKLSEKSSGLFIQDPDSDLLPIPDPSPQQYCTPKKIADSQ